MKKATWVDDCDLTPVPVDARATAEKKTSRGRRITVLLVEDNRRDADLVATYLEKVEGAEFVVERATFLTHALRRLDLGGIDLALVDLGLPDSWGLDTLLKLQERAPGVLMIVLTGTDDEALGLDAVRAGAQDYLVKGMSPAELVRSIRYGLSRQRLRRKLGTALAVARTKEVNLRNILACNLDGIVVIDHRGKIGFANEAAGALLGRVGADLTGSFFPYPIISSTEIEVTRPDGSWIPVEMRLVPMEWENQPAHVALLRDLSERKRVERDREKMRLARQVQQRILPSVAPLVPGFDIAGLTWSAEETGGDYFDFIAMADGNWGIVLGDASGHGFGPALLITETSAFTRAFTTTGEDVGAILTLLNQALSRVAPEGNFVTMFLARLDPRHASLTYANAGHPYGLVLDASGAIRKVLESADPPLTVLAENQFQSSAVSPLQCGDMVVMISDGVLEAQRTLGGKFGMDRMLDVVRTYQAQPAQSIVYAVCRSATDFADGRPHDDVTAVVIKVL